MYVYVYLFFPVYHNQNLNSPGFDAYPTLRLAYGEWRALTQRVASTRPVVEDLQDDAEFQPSCFPTALDRKLLIGHSQRVYEYSK